MLTAGATAASSPVAEQPLSSGKPGFLVYLVHADFSADVFTGVFIVVQLQ